MASSLNTTTITGLLNHLTTNPPQRANRYIINIWGPRKTVGEFMATSVQLPSRGVMFYPDSVGPWTPVWKVPLKTTYDDRLIIEFFVDENFSIRKYIENWMDEIENNTNGSVLDDAQIKEGIIEIIPLPSNITAGTGGKINTTGLPKIQLDYVWPKLILPSEMGVDHPEILKLQVDFTYRSAKWV